MNEPVSIKWRDADLGKSAHVRGRCVGAAWGANGKFWCFLRKTEATYGPFGSFRAAQDELEKQVAA